MIYVFLRRNVSSERKCQFPKTHLVENEISLTNVFVGNCEHLGFPVTPVIAFEKVHKPHYSDKPVSSGDGLRAC